MIAEILSVASMAGGVYLLNKQKSESDQNGNKQSMNVPSQGSYREDPTGEPNGDETDKTEVSDPKDNTLYFGDKTQEYDPFYDYSDSAFDELSLNALTYVPSSMGQALRARLISPALLSTAEEVKAGYNNSGTEFCRSLMAHEFKNSNSEVTYFACGRKIKVRRVAFVLEVFNPFDEEAQLQKIVFNDIKIGNTRCMVMNNYGVVEDGYSSEENFYSSAREIRLMEENGNKKLRYYPYEFNPCTGLWDSNKNGEIKKGWTQPYTKDRHYCTIQPKSSVFIKIPLTLINYDKVSLQFYDLTQFVRLKKNGSREWVNEALAKRWGVNKLSHYQGTEPGTGVLPEMGVERICFLEAPAAPSLRNENLSMKISLYSDEKNFVPKDDLGKRPARASYGATFDLRLLRGHRPQNFTYKWEDSYMGDANIFPTENGRLRDQEEEFELETGFDLFQSSQHYSECNGGGGGMSETVDYGNSLHEPLIEQYGLKTTNI